MMTNINFDVLKINNIDVGQLSKQQQKTALTMLLNQEIDNIVLELKRKSSRLPKQNIDYDDIEACKRLCYLKLHTNTSMFKNNTADNTSLSAAIDSDILVDLYLPTTAYCMEKSTQTESLAFYVDDHLRNIQKDTERFIEHEHNLFEQSLAPEIYIEEITLRKSDSNERLGITVCYNNSEEYDKSFRGLDNISGRIYNEADSTEVYISDIQPDSVACLDGRLRQGDQILQINGKDVKTRPEIETLIAENNNAVTLLVSRHMNVDEGDFNDPSTNEDEVLIVEEDTDDDDFFDENNMTYVNCVINDSCCFEATDELGKALMPQVVQSKQLQSDEMKYKCNTSPSVTHSNLPVYNSKEQQKYLRGESKSWLTCLSKAKCKNKNEKKINLELNIKPHDNYDSEHIYETIPEDSESEPTYCSPYDSTVYVTAMASCTSTRITDALQHFQQKQRVVQWLGIKPFQNICATTAAHQSVHCSIGSGHSFEVYNTSTSGTVHSAVTSLRNGSDDCLVTNITLAQNCQLEDHDNSSSAYNTGGSNNSVSPLTLLLNPKDRSNPNTLLPSSSNIIENCVTDDEFGIQQILQTQQNTHSPKNKIEITSPKSVTFNAKTNTDTDRTDIQLQGIFSDKNINTTKECDVHRNMLLKQQLFDQKLSFEKSVQPCPLNQRCYYQLQQDQIQCPQFTAPNLSQYHFVSSQEGNNLSLNNKVPKSCTTVTETIISKKEEEAMVWKVKRRPDGTRYIVRRPAKTPINKERNARLNVERLRNDMTTTEDDTLSEIKTGRYWTKEERKKHIEKSKERQKIFQQRQNKLPITYDDAVTLCIGDVTNKGFQYSRERMAMTHQKKYVNLIRQQQKTAQKHQQLYQLQFNSVDDRKNMSYINQMESLPNNTSLTLLTTSEKFSFVKENVDKSTVLNSFVFTASEYNQTNKSLKSVTTT